MTNRFSCIVITIMFTVVCTASLASAQVNPDYTSWVQYDIGTSVTSRQVSQVAGQTSKVTLISTLIEKTPQKVVIEIVMRGELGNGEISAPMTSKMEVKAEMQPQRGARGAQPRQEVKESEETITVAGKPFKAKVTETIRKESTQTVTDKTWTSPEFPGFTIKSTKRIDRPQKFDDLKEATGLVIKPAK